VEAGVPDPQLVGEGGDAEDGAHPEARRHLLHGGRRGVERAKERLPGDLLPARPVAEVIDRKYVDELLARDVAIEERSVDRERRLAMAALDPVEAPVEDPVARRGHAGDVDGLRRGAFERFRAARADERVGFEPGHRRYRINDRGWR